MRALRKKGTSPFLSQVIFTGGRIELKDEALRASPRRGGEAVLDFNPPTRTLACKTMKG